MYLMDLLKFYPLGKTAPQTTVYVVFNGISAGCYYLYSDAEEASWDSDEPVQMYKSMFIAKSALTRFKKTKSKSN